MPSSVRPKVTPMSERQQMALLMQMTSNSEAGSRSPSSSSRSKDRNERGETPLHLAAIKGDVEQVCKLLAHRADPNVADFAGWTPLHEACNHGWYEVAVKLIQSGACVNAKGCDNETPLHDAASNGYFKLIKLLIGKGADIYAKNSNGKTPLDVAPATVTPYLYNPSLPLPESSTSTRLPPRSRDDKKITESKPKCSSSSSSDERMDSKASEDVYEFKSAKEVDSPEQKPSDAAQLDSDATETPIASTAPTDEPSTKRNFAEVGEASEDGAANDEESKRKKRKEENVKEASKVATPRNVGQNKNQAKHGCQNKSSALSSAKCATGDKKSPCTSPKPATSDAENEDGKSDLKVPPLKIVIPQSTAEQETGTSRNGKNNSQRAHQALPYVVASSNSNDSNDKDLTCTASPEGVTTSKTDDKKEAIGASVEDQRASLSHQRVLRSSHRSGPNQGGTDRGSNNSSPQLQRSHSPSPSASPAAPSIQSDTPAPTSAASTSTTSSKASDTQANQNADAEASTTSSTTTVNTSAVAAPVVELHPRKRKLKPNKETVASQPEPQETIPETEIHPHDQPITNCYQLYLNIRKQIEKRRRGLFPVQPKPPQGFKDYLMNRCTYVLGGTAATTPNISYPSSLVLQMKDLFTEQEKERYRLRMQHVIEKEKLVLSVEQEILRVHGRAARALANQSLPFSVCTILRDEEVYNLITPEQEEKDRNARSRYNGRLFLSWLQDVDDKWEKIKEAMLLRHHNEAESLHAVQKMDWEWKMKEFSLCDRKITPSIDEHHVPMVHVSDDFDLLPA